MTSEVTRAHLLDAAESVFGERGYAGASIRHITRLAQVDLGAVRYHFGSKDGLFAAVMERRLIPLCAERSRLLDELAARYTDESPPIEEILATFVIPAVRLVRDQGHGRAWTKLLGRVRVEPGRYLDSIQQVYEQLLKRYLAILGRALPELPADELAYRFFFVFGAEVNTLIDDGTLGAMNDGIPGIFEDPEDVCARLIRFVSAGMRAPLPPSSRRPFGVSPKKTVREGSALRTRVG